VNERIIDMINTKIARRKMLKIMSGIALGSTLPLLGKAENKDKKSNTNINTIITDILVIGGGTAGVVAAI
jgi:hypothetical protein